MNSFVFKFKLALISVFLGVSIVFYEKLFVSATQTLYTFNLTLVFIVALCFGILLAISIYNFSLYLYIRSKQYLYYTLAQLSSLFFLANLDSLYIAPFDTIFELKDPILFDLGQLFILTFSLLFLNEFFKSYQIISLHRTIQFILYLTLIDLILALIFGHTVITKFLPIFVFIWLVLSEADRLVSKRDMAFNLVIIGWYTVLLVVAFEYVGFIDFTGIIFPFMHAAFALESILLSTAISYKFKLLEEERHLQQTLLYQKSRLANMGEMVSMIAHQWRQPLHYIAFGLMNIKKELKESEKGIEIIQKLNHQLKYMSNTIENFRNFYNPSKAKTDFNLSQAVQCSTQIVKNSLEIAEIDLQIDIQEDFFVYGNQNELEQVLLNLINNAKDAHIVRKTLNPFIHITIRKPMLTVYDNAGGISLKDQNKIFEPYFTTKTNSDGIGLYLVKKIIEEEFSGKISLQSKQGETVFTMNFILKEVV